MSTQGKEGTWVVSIAGLGKDSSTAITPLGFVWSRAGAGWQPGTSLFQNAYVPLLRKPPSFSPSGVSPLSGNPRAGSVEIELFLNDTTYPEVGRYFLASSGASRQPVTTLDTGEVVAATDSTHAVQTGTAGLLVDDEIYYVGSEAFRKTGNTADVISNNVLVPDGAGGTQLRSTISAGDIAHIGTRAAEHRGQESTNPALPFNDDRLFTSNPFVRGREVLVYWTDGESLEVVRGRYVIESDPQVNAENTALSFRAVDALALLRKRKLNRRPNAYSVSAVLSVGEGHMLTLEGKGKRPTDLVADKVWPEDDWGVYQIDKVAYVAEDSGRLDRDNRSNRGFMAFDGVGRYRSPLPPEDLTKLVGKSAWELLVSDPLDGTEPAGGDLGASDHPFYSSDLGRIATHPYELALCFLGGIASNLPDHWKTIDLPAEWIDVDTIRRQAEDRHRWSVPWVGLVAGMSGKPLDALEFITQQLLVSCAASFGLTLDGKITFRSLLDYDSVTTIDASEILFGRATEIDSSLAVDIVETRFGVGLEDADEAHRMITGDGYQSERFGGARMSLDMHGLVHPDRVFGAGARSNARIEAAGNFATSVGQFLRFPADFAQILITGETEVTAGEYRRFQGPGWRRTDTGLVPEGNVTFIGLIVEAGRDSRTLAQRLQVMRLPYDGKTISPSAEATGYTSGTRTITVTQAQFIETTDASGEYTVGGATHDADTDLLEVGMVCQVEDENGDPITETFEIESITNTTIVHTAGTPIYLIGTTTTWTPAAAPGRDVVVLADSGDARAADVAAYVYEGQGDRFAF